MVISSPRAAFIGRQSVPIQHPDQGDHLRIFAQALQTIQTGLVSKTVSLDASSTTTTLADPRIGVESVLAMNPTTADARTEGMPMITVAKGSATLTHTSDTTTRTYRYVVL